MEALAYEALRIEPEQFYLMTWYEWGIKVAAINSDSQRRLDDHELLIEMFRSSLAYYYNWNSPTNKIDPKDFWKLSYDKEVPVEQKKDVEETVKRLERIAKRRKRRG